MFEPGATFFNAEAGGVPRHLWIVLSKANGAGQLVIANFSSTPPAGGSVLTISRNEHRALSKPSHLRPDHATLANLDKLQEALTKGLIQGSAAMPAAITEKCKASLLASKVVSKEIKDALGR